MGTRTGTGWRTAVTAAAALALAGCGEGRPADRAGGDTVLLRLATIDGDVKGNGQAVGPETFVRELAGVSGGRLQVEVSTTYGNGEADAESRLVEAIATGELDGGWPATRAFAGAGIRGLEAVEAPMALSSTAAVGALVTGPAAGTALGVLDGSGVEGLALSAGPLRRPFAAGEPLLGPEDWAGQRFRVYNSPVQSDTVTALGGEPVDVGLTWVDEVVAGQLRGAEFDVAQYAHNGLTTEAGAVTADVVLWPKVFVLALSEERFDALSDQQQEWVRDAANRAAQASVENAIEDDARAEDLCGSGVRFVPAGEERVEAMRAAVAPVLEELAADPATAPLMEEVQTIAREHPDPEVVDVPTDCRTGDGAAEEAPVAAGTAEVPDGVYRVEITTADVAEAGIDNGPGWSGTWTLEIEKGTYVVTCRPVDMPGRDCGTSSYDGPLEAGQLRGSGQTVTFAWDAEMMTALTGCDPSRPVTEDGACYPVPPYSAEWRLDGDELVFRHVGGEELHSLTLEPYRKIA